MNSLDSMISVSRGTQPADIILGNARILNVFNGEIEAGNVAIYHGKIVGVGDYKEAGQFIDLNGKYLAPGLINGHVHLESSMLNVSQYARAILPHGTLSIVTDLHEIANVSGLNGIEYVLKVVRKLPMDLFLMAPSCVPATHMETSGARIGPEEIRRLLRLKECIGLGEVMNFPGVLFADVSILKKLNYARRKIIDGHCPALGGKDLNAYISAGIMSDHESISLDEAKEKLQRGMRIMIREGSSEKNLDALLPLVNDNTYKRCIFVVDDRTCVDILRDGDIDAVIRKAINKGLDPVRAVQMATINTAEYFHLQGLGAIAPGYFANLIVIEDLTEFNIINVFYHGKPVAERGKPLFSLNRSSPIGLSNTIKALPLDKDKLSLKSTGNPEPIIEVIPGQIVTRRRQEKMPVENGVVVPDVERDILKLAVIERHKMTGNVGVGLVNGIGLRNGALASTIAHDSHNIVVVGTNDDDIITAVNEIIRLKGGLVIAANGKVLSSLPLPVAGLLSEMLMEKVVTKLEELESIARKLGCLLPSPFATLSFLALPVIPELRLTDLGMVDVNEFKLIERS